MIAHFIYTLFFLLLKEKRERYPRLIVMVGELVSLFISLSVYWFTGQAFGKGGLNPVLNGVMPDYFHYIIWNDVSLLIPFAALSGSLQTIKELHSQGALEMLLTLPVSRWRLIFMMQLPHLFKELVRMFLIFFAASFFFHFQINIEIFLSLLIIEILSFPLFHSMGLAFVGIYLAYGRGEGLLSFFSMMGALFGGAYFPPVLFPEMIRHFFINFSPFNLYLDLARAIFSKGSHSIYSQATVHILLFGVVGFFLSLALFQWGLQKIRIRGSIDLYH